MALTYMDAINHFSVLKAKVFNLLCSGSKFFDRDVVRTSKGKGRKGWYQPARIIFDKCLSRFPCLVSGVHFPLLTNPPPYPTVSVIPQDWKPTDRIGFQYPTGLTLCETSCPLRTALRKKESQNDSFVEESRFFVHYGAS